MTVSINGTSGFTFNDGSTQATAGFVPFRNRIINGDMRIDQRNAGASVTPASGDYTLDRFQCFSSASSKYSVQRDTTAPTGFTNSLKVTSLAATSVAAGDYYMIEHKIEGFNVADLAWGTANAKTVTLSFQVYSSLTGTFGGAILNSASNRSYPFNYSVASANTWTTLTVTIPGDTTGTWLTTNGTGLYISFSLGMGSTYSGTAGSWAGAQYWSATGATSVVGTNGATFYITGVQLEAGSVATPFERVDYGTQLARCQRYYWKLQSTGTNNIGPAMGWTSTVYLGTLSFPVTMRAAPTGSVSSSTAFTFIAAGNAYQSSAVTNVAAGATDQTTGFDITRGSGGITPGHAGQLRFTAASDWIAYSAEL